MSIDARIAVLPVGRESVDLREVTLDEVGPYEVIVEQSAFGVCHSQLDRIYRMQRNAAMVLGHESVGRIIAVGDQVDYVRVGDFVVTTWIARDPLAGRQPRATQVTFADGLVARTHNTFTWGTHAVLDEQYVVKVGSGISTDLGAVIGCAVMTGAGAVVNSAKVQPGQSVAVWGAGGVGLCAVGAAAVSGADPIIAIDVDDTKLELARRFGATHVINARDDDPTEAVRAMTPRDDGSPGVDVSIDCTGLGSNVPVSLAAVRGAYRGSGLRGGINVLVGIPREPFELNAMTLIEGEKALLGCVGGNCSTERDFATFQEWSHAGRFDEHALVTNRYTLDELNTAVADLHHGRVQGRAVIEL